MRLFLALLTSFMLQSCSSLELRPVKVIKLFDGDSFLVEDYPCNNCQKFQVRLLGIDAPESKQAPWGNLAQKKLDSLIAEDRVIFLEYDFDKRDKYKRDLAYAFSDKSKELLINEALIKSGHAELFAFAKDLRYLDRLKQAEIEARKAKIGIWSEKGGLKTSPYKFRKQNKA